MRVLIAGSSGAIAEAVAKRMREEGDHVFTLSRSGEPSATHCVADLTKPSSVEQIKAFVEKCGPLDAVFCGTGLLHGGWNMPEKSLSQLSMDWLQQNMLVNVQTHIHLAQAVASLVKRSSPIKWVSLSAMVGSLKEVMTNWKKER